MPQAYELTRLAAGRKDCVLHARIPPALDEALRQRAEQMNVPMSRLVRDLLAEAISQEDWEAPGLTGS